MEFDDAPLLVRLLNEPSFIENIGDRGVHSLEDAHRYLREGPMAMYEKYGFGLWHTALKDGTFIGMCGMLKRDNLPDPDLGYAYLPEFWGQGFAYEAAAATLQHCAQKFGLTRAPSVSSMSPLRVTTDPLISAPLSSISPDTVETSPPIFEPLPISTPPFTVEAVRSTVTESPISSEPFTVSTSPSFASSSTTISPFTVCTSLAAARLPTRTLPFTALTSW
jgi:hypothetical protein